MDDTALNIIPEPARNSRRLRKRLVIEGGKKQCDRVGYRRCIVHVSKYKACVRVESSDVGSQKG